MWSVSANLSRWAIPARRTPDQTTPSFSPCLLHRIPEQTSHGIILLDLSPEVALLWTVNIYERVPFVVVGARRENKGSALRQEVVTESVSLDVTSVKGMQNLCVECVAFLTREGCWTPWTGPDNYKLQDRAEWSTDVSKLFYAASKLVLVQEHGGTRSTGSKKRLDGNLVAELKRRRRAMIMCFGIL